MKLVAQMDEISSIDIEIDSTFAILLEAQNRGHEVFYYLPNELSFDLTTQKVLAPLKKVHLKKEKGNHFKIIEVREYDLTKVDVILFRQDPPFDMSYITSTYILEKIKNQVLILNDPTEIRNCPEKIFVSSFPDLVPPTLITSNFLKAKEFFEKHREAILKPLYSYGGEGVVLLREGDVNFASIFEIMIKTYQNPLIVQKFLPEIKKGDRRIILVDGECVGGVARLAKNSEIRSNFHAGGFAEKITISSKEKEICKKIGPELKRRGLFFVGIDIIGDYITEINVTSPTCIVQINQFNNISLEGLIIKEIENKLAYNTSSL